MQNFKIVPERGTSLFGTGFYWRETFISIVPLPPCLPVDVIASVSISTALIPSV